VKIMVKSEPPLAAYFAKENLFVVIYILMYLVLNTCTGGERSFKDRGSHSIFTEFLSAFLQSVSLFFLKRQRKSQITDLFIFLINVS